jgi:hypothetical protein
MWQKVRSIWKYIAAYYLDEFDWFLLGGDDMYYIMENLYNYLQSAEIQNERAKGDGRLYLFFCWSFLSFVTPGVYLGRPFLNYEKGNYLYNTGGPGYLLDRTALKVI